MRPLPSSGAARLSGEAIPSATVCSSILMLPLAMRAAMGFTILTLLTVTVTLRDVVEPPLLSRATAVNVCVPAKRVAFRVKGLSLSFPRDVAPSKNSTLVTVPSESSAAAVMVTAALLNDDPFVGLEMLTVGGTLGGAKVPRE